MPNDIAPNTRRVAFLAEVGTRLDAFELSLVASGVPDAPARRERVAYQFKALSAAMDDFELEGSLPLLESLMLSARTDAEVAHLTAVWGIRSSRIEDLYQKYDAVVWDSIWRTLRDPNTTLLPFYKDEVARDLHGVCWLKIVEKIGKYRDSGKLSGWIWQVCENVVLDWKRSSARRWSSMPEEQLSNVREGSRPRRVSRLLTFPNRGLRFRKAALCPECGDETPKRIIRSTKSTLTLSCGHSRPKGL